VQCAAHVHEGEYCEDTREHCEVDAAAGKCATDPKVRQACVRACTGCCGDGHPNCRTWAFSGECARNQGFMRSTCKASCHQCDRDPTAAAAAEGLHRAASPSSPSPPPPPSPPSPPSPAQKRTRREPKERGRGGAAVGGAARAALGNVGARRRRRRALEQEAAGEEAAGGVPVEAAERARPTASRESASEASGAQFARRAAETEARREPLAESESEQLRQRVVLVWEVMLVLAAAYCAHRTCSRRCAGGKSAHEVGAKRIAL